MDICWGMYAGMHEWISVSVFMNQTVDNERSCHPRSAKQQLSHRKRSVACVLGVLRDTQEQNPWLKVVDLTDELLYLSEANLTSPSEKM
jgi:hypothetical protein